MSDEHVPSPHWDHCSTCHYPWPCRDALLVQIAALREGLEFYAQQRIYSPPAGATVGVLPYILADQGRRARSLLAPPAEEEHDAEYEQKAAAAEGGSGKHPFRQACTGDHHDACYCSAYVNGERCMAARESRIHE